MKKKLLIWFCLFAVLTIAMGLYAFSCNKQAGGTLTNSPPRTPRPTNSIGNINANRISANSASNAKSVNSMSTPKVAVTEKKSDSLFPFPPPQPVDSIEIPYQDLVNGETNPTFSNVAKTLADKLETANYSRGKYSYFWNTENEFAIVTRMERINADGTAFADPNGIEDLRWNFPNHLPTAKSKEEYGPYLFSGKKVFYRVFAFIVTMKDPLYFTENAPPTFELAQKWHRLGRSELGGGETSSIVREIEFGSQYHCYALLYLFINHTSLDSEKAVNGLDDADRGLKDYINKEALHHLSESQIWRKEQ
jgi:hypothetical protein